MSTIPLKPLNCAIEYAIEHPLIQLEPFHPFFEQLPVDPYLDSSFRSRRFSRFTIIDHQIQTLPHRPFFQSKAYNPLLGNVVRDYPELDPNLVQLPSFQSLLHEFWDFCQVCTLEPSIGVHQIRINVSTQQFADPAPEGIHQDGVNLVGIFCVNRHHVRGGITHLYRLPTAPPILNKVLNPGELLIFNDQTFFHFTTPIFPDTRSPGWRDVFILTAPSMPESGSQQHNRIER